MNTKIDNILNEPKVMKAITKAWYEYCNSVWNYKYLFYFCFVLITLPLIALTVIIRLLLCKVIKCHSFEIKEYKIEEAEGVIASHVIRSCKRECGKIEILDSFGYWHDLGSLPNNKTEYRVIK